MPFYYYSYSIAQLEAVSALERFPTQGAKRALVDIIEDEKTFFKVRCAGKFDFMESSTLHYILFLLITYFIYF